MFSRKIKLLNNATYACTMVLLSFMFVACGDGFNSTDLKSEQDPELVGDPNLGNRGPHNPPEMSPPEIRRNVSLSYTAEGEPVDSQEFTLDVSQSLFEKSLGCDPGTKITVTVAHIMVGGNGWLRCSGRITSRERDDQGICYKRFEKTCADPIPGNLVFTHFNDELTSDSSSLDDNEVIKTQLRVSFASIVEDRVDPTPPPQPPTLPPNDPNPAESCDPPYVVWNNLCVIDEGVFKLGDVDIIYSNGTGQYCTYGGCDLLESQTKGKYKCGQTFTSLPHGERDTTHDGICTGN